MTKTIQHYIAAFEAFAGNGASASPEWLKSRRASAIARFADQGFPSRREESWRFTDISPLAESAYRLVEEPLDVRAHELDSYTVSDEARAVVVVANGRMIPRLSHLPALPDGVVVGSLAEAFTAGHPAVELHLGSSGADRRTAFGALNTAFLDDGVFVYLPKDVRLVAPIHVVFYSAGGPKQDALILPRLLVVADEGAEGTVLETHAGAEGDRYWTSPVSEYVLGPNARVDSYRIQRESTRSYHTAVQHSRLARDANCSVVTFSFGAALSRQDIVSVLDGEGAKSTVNGLSVLGARQHVDYHTTLEHAKPHCNSWEYFNGVFADRARGVFTGRIIVQPGAQKTDSKQTNNNVLLSSQARADSQPQLEIYADDVRCTHGATLGPIDDAHLFYLQSRGLRLEDARKLLTYGFASEILNGIRYEPLRAMLDTFVQERLAVLTGAVPEG